jgi:tRNA(Ile)-lysidine synthase
MMKDKFTKHLLDQLKIPVKSRILVAVSGGLDSIALLNLLKQSDTEIGVAHANFQLRGDESDCDEVFVKELAAKYNLPFFSKRFDTNFVANQKGFSIQMAARKLRYDWFEKLASEHRWGFVATAHHLDDQIETFFINLLRGTGISGLKGIPERNGIYIRPLLSFYRSEIEEYVRTLRLDYREDSSNLKTDYLRNRVRHHLIPLLDELQPAFRKVMAGNLEHLASAETFFRNSMNDLINGIVKKDKSLTQISISLLQESKHPELALHEILQEYNFSTTQIQQIFKALESQPGKIFLSATHRLIKDREYLVLQARSELSEEESGSVIEEDTSEIFTPIHLQFQTLARDLDFQPSADPDKAFLDFESLSFPLRIRKWQHGDRFKPLGMKGQVKLSDFFVANKFSIAEKEKVWLMVDKQDQIIWIIGQRIADQNRIKAVTKRVFNATLIH